MDTLNTLVDKEDKLVYCDTEYPVILVSGLGLTEHHALYNYWGNTPDYLKEHGAAVFTARQAAFSSHVDNALSLKHRIFEVLDKTGKDKINIIGHSRGGTEARYMISVLEMGEQTASLTTLGTPHHGSVLADIIVGKLPVGQLMVARLVNLFARMMGDESPDSLRAALSVTTEAMAQFNRDVQDHPDVYYQSYAGHVNKSHGNLMMKTLAGIHYRFGGKNDGLVSIESAQWGEFKGIISDANCSSVSHNDMIGISRMMGGSSKFDHNAFLAGILHELKQKGL
jgi:triacylglycerol lipase